MGMSREIKFRALCIADDIERMVYFNLPEMDNGLWAWPMPNDILHIDEYLTPLMQFTGIKDEKDNDIYDGDIVKRGQIIKKVEWIIGYTYNGWNIGTGYDYPKKTKAKLEVIGNIYQSPELLNA